MYVVKLSSTFPKWPILRQSPSGDGVWGNCKFVTDPHLAKYDFWVVLDGIQSLEHINCDPQNTLLVTCEPPDIKSYSSKFINQFNTILTCHRIPEHPHVIKSQQGLPWMIGASYSNHTKTWNNFLRFSDLENLHPIKKKLISIVTSNKSMVEGHQIRNAFLNALRGRFGDQIDIFGQGYNPIPDKLDAIGPYKYHLVIENSNIDDYWTEKLSDAFIGECFPIYYGCPNIYEYFNEKSMECIDIRNVEDSLNKIEKIINSDLYNQRVSYIKSSKKDVLNKFNILAICSTLIEQRLQEKGSNLFQSNKLTSIAPDIAIHDASMKKSHKWLLLIFFLKRTADLLKSRSAKFTSRLLSNRNSP